MLRRVKPQRHWCRYLRTRSRKQRKSLSERTPARREEGCQVSYGLNLGWTGPRFFGGPTKGYTTNLNQGSSVWVFIAVGAVRWQVRMSSLRHCLACPLSFCESCLSEGRHEAAGPSLLLLQCSNGSPFQDSSWKVVSLNSQAPNGSGGSLVVMPTGRIRRVAWLR